MGVMEEAWAWAVLEPVVEGITAELVAMGTEEPAVTAAAVTVGMESTTVADEAVDVEVTAVGEGRAGRRTGLVTNGISDEVMVVGDDAATTTGEVLLMLLLVSRAWAVIDIWEAADSPVLSNCGSLPKTTSRADEGMSLRPGTGEDDWLICHC